MNDVTMEQQLDFERLRKEKVSIMLAIPMYGGMCHGMLMRSVNELTILCCHQNIELKYYYLFNESLITRARNYCADEFLRSECTHLMFIDSDIGFSAIDVFALLQIQVMNKEKIDIIAGPYPKKSIAWEKVMKAAKAGMGDENPYALEDYAGDLVFNPASDKMSFRLDQPLEVLEAGTGFMCIPRATFEKYDEAYPDSKYLPDHVRTKAFDGSREIMAYFDCVIDPDTRRYLSEDYYFCQNVRKAGMHVWMCPWMELKHVGSHIYSGSLGKMVQLQLSPTASDESNPNRYDDSLRKGSRKKRRGKR